MFSIDSKNNSISVLQVIKLWGTGFPGGASGKESTFQYRIRKRCGFSPRVEKILWRRAWQLIQYACLKNPMDRKAWQGIVHRVTKSQTRPSDLAHTQTLRHTGSKPHIKWAISQMRIQPQKQCLLSPISSFCFPYACQHKCQHQAVLW